MLNEKELKDVFVKLIREFELSDDNTEIIICEHIVKYYTDFDNGYIVETKIHNLLKLLNDTRNKSEAEFGKLMKRDSTEDIWYLV